MRQRFLVLRTEGRAQAKASGHKLRLQEWHTKDAGDCPVERYSAYQCSECGDWLMVHLEDCGEFGLHEDVSGWAVKRQCTGGPR
jgi:hypothetical protein